MPIKLDLPNSVLWDYAPNCNAWTLQDHLTAKGIDYQLIPPNLHHHNAAKRAICTFKNHFIADLCSTDKDFPIHLWDRLLLQAELSLNLLHGSCINSSLSAWAQLHGTFDFNHTPITPPGIQVLMHEKPTAQCTWAPHCSTRWYLGMALKSYQCYTVWITEMHAQCICTTLTWLPTKVPMPTASSIDLVLLAGIQDITTALQNPSANSPLAPLQPKCSAATAHGHPSWHHQVERSTTASSSDYSTRSEGARHHHNACSTSEGDPDYPT